MTCIEHTQKAEYGMGWCKLSRTKARIHRVALAEAMGVPVTDLEGQHVLHACDNPRCINPEHLSLGTRSDNMQDAAKKGRLSGRDNAKRVPQWKIDWVKKHLIPNHRTRGLASLCRLVKADINTMRGKL